MKIDQETLISQISSILNKSNNHAFIIGGIEINIGSPFDLIEYIKTLPEPREENLIIEVRRLILKEFHSKDKASEYLGINKRTLYREKHKLIKQADHD